MKPLDERWERLIVRMLDGEISPEERMELEREMVRSPELRRAAESYQQIDDRCARVVDGILEPKRRPALRVTVPASAPLYRRRSNWMLYVSAAAACLAIFLLWNTPPAAAPSSSPAGANRSDFSGGSTRLTPASVPVADLPGRGAGVYSVSDLAAPTVDRVTGRNIIVIPGADGQFYLLGVDHMREFVQPTRLESDAPKATKHAI